MYNYQRNLEYEVTTRTQELKFAIDSIKAASLETIHRLSVASEYKDKATASPRMWLMHPLEIPELKALLMQYNRAKKY
jgi:hypothetical protein